MFDVLARFELLQSDLVRWHSARPQLAIAGRDAWTLWTPDGMRPVPAFESTMVHTASNTVAWADADLIVADDVDLVQRVSTAGSVRWTRRSEIGRVDEIEVSARGDIACVGQTLAVLDPDGVTRWSRGPRHEQPDDGFEVEWPERCTWLGERLLVIYPQGSELLDVAGHRVATVRTAATNWVGVAQEEIRVATFAPPAPWIRSTTFSAAGSAVAAEGDGHGVWIRDASGTRHVEGHPRTLTALAWSPRQELFTGCRDGVVLRETPAGFEPVTRLADPIYGLYWSADGRYLCCTSNRDGIVVNQRPAASPP